MLKNCIIILKHLEVKAGKQMNRGNLIEILKKKIVVLDGAMGTSIQNYNLNEKDFRGDLLKDFHKDQKGNNDILSITKPEVIKEIHRSFLEAGTDILKQTHLIQQVFLKKITI